MRQGRRALAAGFALAGACAPAHVPAQSAYSGEWMVNGPVVHSDEALVLRPDGSTSRPDCAWLSSSSGLELDCAGNPRRYFLVRFGLREYLVLHRDKAVCGMEWWKRSGRPYDLVVPAEIPFGLWVAWSRPRSEAPGMEIEDFCSSAWRRLVRD